MRAPFEASLQSQLAAEQAPIQSSKFQGRMLEEYNRYLFRGQDYPNPRSSDVTHLARPYSTTPRVSLQGVLDGMYRMKCWPVNWADMGAGRALTMRQVAMMPELAGKVAMTAVDLFDYGLEGLNHEEMTYLESEHPGTTLPTAKPAFAQGNAETVQLPDKPDLITSIEMMHYLDSPLGSIVNWYNQLADDGLLIAATEHPFGPSMLYKGRPDHQDGTMSPAAHFVKNLEDQGIPVAATHSPDWLGGGRYIYDAHNFRTLALRKQAGTRLQLMSPVIEVGIGIVDYKTTFHDARLAASEAIVEVVRQ